MALFLVASCGIDTTMTTTTSTSDPSTTTTTLSVPTSLDLDGVLEVMTRYFDFIQMSNMAPLDGPAYSDDVASQTFLRSQMEPIPASSGLSWMLDTKDVLAALTKWLEGCPMDTDPNFCQRSQDGVFANIRFGVADGWLEIQYFVLKTLLIGPETIMVTTYDGLKLSLIPGDYAFVHLSLGPTDDPTPLVERTRQATYESNGSWEVVQWTSLDGSRMTYDALTEVTTRVSFGPTQLVSVQRIDPILHRSASVSFASNGEILNQNLRIGTKNADFDYFRSAADNDVVLLSWNAFLVQGWDKLTFDDASRAKLFEGDQEVAGAFHIGADAWDGHFEVDLSIALDAALFDESALSLAKWGLSYDGIGYADFAAELAELPASALDWIASQGCSLNREESLAFLSTRITVTVDWTWIASLFVD
jgi:hypothetical protein